MEIKVRFSKDMTMDSLKLVKCVGRFNTQRRRRTSVRESAHLPNEG